MILSLIPFYYQDIEEFKVPDATFNTLNTDHGSRNFSRKIEKDQEVIFSVNNFFNLRRITENGRKKIGTLRLPSLKQIFK